MRLALAALMLASAVPAAASTPADGQSPRQWTWTSGKTGVRALTVRIVRGSYRIIRRPGAVFVAMSVRGPSGDPEAVQFSVGNEDGVTISDVYPATRIRSWKECLPPRDARGDFWASNAVIDAVIEAPRSFPITVEVMDPRGPAGADRSPGLH